MDYEMIFPSRLTFDSSLNYRELGFWMKNKQKLAERNKFIISNVNMAAARGSGGKVSIFI